MDKLEEEFSAAFAVSDIPNNPAAPHPRFSQYKRKSNVPNQEERRKRLLEMQKKQRYDSFSHARRLAEGDFEASGSEEEEGDQVEAMEWSTQHKHSRKAKKLNIKRRPRGYANQLMFSEWLVDVPEDLMEKWFFVLCPVGKRVLVVASRGKTSAYSKNGYCISTFSSKLPGGSRALSSHHTIVDCIWSEADQTFYVLDVLSWSSHPVLDCETEFRFFWLQTKMSEASELSEKSSENQQRFKALPYYHCNPETMYSAINSPLPFNLKLDGLLFYHKDTHYIPGPTPLVGWLKAYMLPEMLNVSVPETYVEEKPSWYTSLGDHVNLKAKSRDIKKPPKNRKSSEGKMDVETVSKQEMGVETVPTQEIGVESVPKQEMDVESVPKQE